MGVDSATERIDILPFASYDRTNTLSVAEDRHCHFPKILTIFSSGDEVGVVAGTLERIGTGAGCAVAVADAGNGL